MEALAPTRIATTHVELRTRVGKLAACLVAPAEIGQRADERLYILSYRDISQARRIDRMRSDFVANALALIVFEQLRPAI